MDKIHTSSKSQCSLLAQTHMFEFLVYIHAQVFSNMQSQLFYLCSKWLKWKQFNVFIYVSDSIYPRLTSWWLKTCQRQDSGCNNLVIKSILPSGLYPFFNADKGQQQNFHTVGPIWFINWEKHVNCDEKFVLLSLNLLLQSCYNL